MSNKEFHHMVFNASYVQMFRFNIYNISYHTLSYLVEQVYL